MGAAGKPCGVRKYSPVARNSQCHLTRTRRRDVRASVPPPHGDAVAEGTELRSQQEARRVGGGPATMTGPQEPVTRLQSQNRKITSLHLPTAAACGTKRNCRGAHGISGAEGRPAVPSTWPRRQSAPIGTPPCSDSERLIKGIP